MNLQVINENSFIIFIIDKKLIPELNENEITKYLKKIFLNIKDKYNLEIYGYYDVLIFFDEKYGMIIKLDKEELEYLSYYNKQIEMKIIISNNQVFYKVLDLFNIDKRILNKSDIYFYKDEIFLELKSRIDFVLLGNLIENSKIVFENIEKEKWEKIEIR